MTKLSRKERMQKAEEMAGISFWVDLRKGRLSKYTVQKKVKGAVMMFFRYAILASLGFLVITPIWKLVKDALTAPLALTDKSSIWIPTQISPLFIQLTSSTFMLDYWKALAYSLTNALILTVLQVLSTGLAAYSFARLKFKGSNLLFFGVILTIVVPNAAMTFAQYNSFRNFDILGIFGLFTNGQGLNLLDKPAALFVLAASGMGIKSGLYIYFMRQAIRGLPISIEEAAHVDGAGFLRTFFTIVVPSMSGSILTVTVLSFLWNYTDTYFVSLLNKNNLNLAYHIGVLQANIRWDIDAAAKNNPDWINVINASNPFVQNAAMSACALLTVLPLIIMYCFVQKRFVQGVARSGLGGD